MAHVGKSRNKTYYGEQPEKCNGSTLEMTKKWGLMKKKVGKEKTHIPSRSLHNDWGRHVRATEKVGRK